MLAARLVSAVMLLPALLALKVPVHSAHGHAMLIASVPATPAVLLALLLARLPGVRGSRLLVGARGLSTTVAVLPGAVAGCATLWGAGLPDLLHILACTPNGESRCRVQQIWQTGENTCCVKQLRWTALVPLAAEGFQGVLQGLEGWTGDEDMHCKQASALYRA